MARIANAVKKVNCVTKTLNRSQCFCVCFCACVCLLVGHFMSPHPSDQLSEKKQLSPTALHCSNDAESKHFFISRAGPTHTFPKSTGMDIWQACPA